jgi:hypothetical protein
MQDMTPEERFTKIENLLATVAEYQAENQARRDAEIDKHNAAIRDLVVVSRTLLDSHERIEAEIDKLREAQLATDEKLHILIETVDRIIRNK